MNWYAVNAKSRQESVAELNLRRLGLETFYPQLKQTKLIRRRRQTSITSLFPGYLFAKFAIEKHCRAVSYARGVRKVVTFGQAPAIVDDEIIESIKRSLEDGYVTLLHPRFRPGQSVRIKEGPFQGIDAVFEREMSDQERVVLLLQTLSYQARVIVDADQVAVNM
jgi:transcriptional antiterminator RfaH